MQSWLVQAFSFFMKEIHEIRRQPRLLLSLIGGPFIVLSLFGATFRSASPVLSTVLVWPAGGLPGIEPAEIERAISRRFKLIGVLEDRNEALRMLESGRVDVVQVLPDNIVEKVLQGTRPQLEVYSYAIDPTAEAWIQSLTFSEVSYINTRVLLANTGQAQQQAVTIQVELRNAQGVLSELETNITPEQQRRAESVLDTLRNALNFLLMFLPPPVDGQENQQIAQLLELRRQIVNLLEALGQLDQAIRSGELQNHLDQLRDFNQQLDDLQLNIDLFVGLAPETIVSPLQLAYRNLRSEAYSLMVFYAPGVLALLIQHLAITLGALAWVRERLMGAFEMFRVAPLSIGHLLVGKTLAYSLYVLMAAGALTILLNVLNVPLLGPPVLFVAMVLMLTLASVGIGLLISAVSTSDSQAVQMTMITLLLSIFFTGFFLPLGGFTELARPVSAMIPMTHGLAGLQAVMLIGRSPDVGTWLGLALIILVSYALVLLVMRRVYRRVTI